MIPIKYVIVVAVFAVAVALGSKIPSFYLSDLYFSLPGNSKLGWLLEIPSGLFRWRDSEIQQ